MTQKCHTPPKKRSDIQQIRSEEAIYRLSTSRSVEIWMFRRAYPASTAS